MPRARQANRARRFVSELVWEGDFGGKFGDREHAIGVSPSKPPQTSPKPTHRPLFTVRPGRVLLRSPRSPARCRGFLPTFEPDKLPIGRALGEPGEGCWAESAIGTSRRFTPPPSSWPSCAGWP